MREMIVFVHGMCHGSWCWEEQFIPYFEKQGYNCIKFNLPCDTYKSILIFSAQRLLSAAK
jgi:hypothetical protein